MGQKINPFSYRLGVINAWQSRWFPRKNYKSQLEEDLLIRRIINDRIKLSGIVSVEIERGSRETYRVIIRAAKPGLIIGRGGKGIEELAEALNVALRALHRKRGKTIQAGSASNGKEKATVNLTIEELKRSETSAQYVAQTIAWEMERRQPFRRTIKKALEGILQNRDVKGAKIKVSGRLDGNEIARRETVAKGSLPLQTLRANIDYGQATSYNTYGTVGIKVWVYKGDVFAKKGNGNAPAPKQSAPEPRSPRRASK